MASKKEFEPNPDQGTLFNLNTPNLEPALTDQQSFRIEPGPSISVEERSRRLIEALYVLGRMSSNSGFNKAQFSQTENEKLYYKYGTYGIEDVNKKIDGAKLAKERKLRNIFMAGTGYILQDRASDSYDKNAEGNMAFKKFVETFRGPENAKQRNKFKQDLVKFRKKQGFSQVDNPYTKKSKND